MIRNIYILLLLSLSYSATLLVPDEYPTIQSAIDAASEGDSVLVSAGTYLENINFNGKNIAVIGEDRETTIIDGGLNDQVMYIDNSEVLVKNFTIKNGDRGIHLTSSSQTVIQNNILYNANHNDKGIVINNSDSVKILDNIIENYSHGILSGGGDVNLIIKGNQIINNSYGILINDNSDFAVIDSNIVIGNTFGIYIIDASGSIITNNIITEGNGSAIVLSAYCYGFTVSGNTITHNGGSGISTNRSYGDITNNLIIDNDGDGIYIETAYSGFNIHNNTIDGHSGYGLYWNSNNQSNYTLTATNNSITNNQNGIYCSNGSNYNTIAYNNSWNNSSDNYSGSLPTGTGNLTDINANGNVCDISSNISENPLYINPDNDNFYIDSDSPCIDAGNPDSPLDPDASIADMGAYYYHQEGVVSGCTDPAAANYDPEATVDDGSCFYCDLGDVNCDGSLNVLDIVLAANMVLADEYDEIADMNEDGELNILDLVIMVNLVLYGDDDPCIDMDGNVYETVQIGDQLWMAENLKVTHYQNGDEIPNITNNGDWGSYDEPQYGVYNNDSTNADIYGNLYNWPVVGDERGVCPEGFHVPPDEEFMELEMFLGMSEEEANSTGYRGTDEGSKLAGNSVLWNDGELVSNPEFGTSGFNGLPAGYRESGSGNGNYGGMGVNSYFWTSSEGSLFTDAWYRCMSSPSSRVNRYIGNKALGRSIRCLGD